MDEIKIKWEEWRDPFGRDIDKSDDWPEIERNFKEKNVELFSDEDVDISPDDMVHPLDPKNRPIHIVATPMGIVPMTDNTMPSKVFNFWVGHTNFTITPQIEDVIKKVDGVEVLRVMSRYRLQLGVGKLFQEMEVFKCIENAVKDAISTNIRRVETDSRQQCESKE